MVNGTPIRVLYSFPHKIGAGRICQIAWHQADGVAAAGAKALIYPGSVHRALAKNIACEPTLARGKFRMPYRILGTYRACELHDRIVAHRLSKLVGKIDVIHAWPLGALYTFKEAKRLGIPTLLERPNTHTRYAYGVVQRESERLGISLPPGSEGAFDERVLRKEEREYELADQLLCPSDFVVRTFLEEGFSQERLARHNYGFDEKVYFPSSANAISGTGFRLLFVGFSAVRKGVHHALEAWLQSPASKSGVFQIAGEFLPEYAEKLSPLLSHPSVRVLGHRNDVPELMRNSDALVLPSVEEGFGLVVVEGMASGCVPLASTACTEAAGLSGYVHEVGDIRTLSEQITMLHEDRDLLQRRRENSIAAAKKYTWAAVGRELYEVYQRTAAKGPTPAAIN